MITYIRPEVARIAPSDHPLVHATIENLYEVLKKLIHDSDYRDELGRQSREYAIANHDYRILGHKLLDLYQLL